MPKAKQLLLTGDEIFRDRRSVSNKAALNEQRCRRSNSFNKAETMPWWLKINYVNQHLHAVSSKETHKHNQKLS
jgi:hypothetical protein